MATIKEIFAVDSFYAYLRYLFVTGYNCFSMLAWVLLKRAAFCGIIVRMWE